MFVAAVIAALGGALPAQEVQPWVAVQGGYDWQQSASRGAENHSAFGVSAGTWCTPYWGGDLSILNTRLDPRGTGDSSSETHVHASALLDLDPGNRQWTPYLRAGLGGTRLAAPFSMGSGTTTRFSFHGGAGIQSSVFSPLLVGLEGRVIRIETQTPYNEWVGLISVGYRWGGTATQATLPADAAPQAPAPQAAPAPAPPAPAVEEPNPPMPVPAPAPAPAPVLVPAPPAPAAAAPTRIVLDEAVLHFANGSSTLPGEGVQAVRKVAASLKAYPGTYAVVVSGHTSPVGSVAGNQALSKQRAEAVARVLVASGIPASAIRSVGMGSTRPVASNQTPAGQARNRRVEIEIQPSGVPAQTRTT
jgi:OOP family OmpA-OmpF porin